MCYIDILRMGNPTHAGLGMYGDSEDSDSGDDIPDDSSPPRANGADSDQELRVSFFKYIRYIYIYIYIYVYLAKKKGGGGKKEEKTYRKN